jgi:simple sugar transport system permease protein
MNLVYFLGVWFIFWMSGLLSGSLVYFWGFSIIIPYVSFEGGFHIEFLTLIHLSDVSPLGAIFITLCLILLLFFF